MTDKNPSGPTVARIRSPKPLARGVYLGAFLAFLSAGCDSDPRARLALDSVPAAGTASLAAACDVVLLTHGVEQRGGGDPLDRRIAGYQKILNAAAGTRPAYMERLGWAYIGKARATLDPGYHTLALKTAECMQTRVGSAPETLLLQGHALHNLHRFAEAQEIARRLVALRGRWFDYGLLGDTLLELGRFEDAVRAYQAMMDERPGPEVYARAARVRWLAGDTAGAVDMMGAAVAAMGRRENEPLAWALVQLAKYQSALKERVAADRSVDRALRVYSKYPPALLERGRHLLAAGRVTEAVPILRLAESLNPNPESQWALIEALEQQGAPAEAALIEARVMDSGARLDPRTVSLFLATRGPEPGRALTLSAEELAVRQDIYTLDAHAWALLAGGRVAEAIDFCRRALATGTEDARLFFHAGVIHARAGEGAAARRWFRRAQDLEEQLWPSERRALHDEFATLELSISARLANFSPTGTTR